MGAELVPLNQGDIEIAAVAERARFAPVMNIQVAMARRDAVKEAFSKLMEEGHDYGKVAGIGKPTLLQPGAQKLDNLFGLVPRFPMDLMRIEEDWTGEAHGGEPFFRYVVVCQLMRGEFVMGEAIGECNSWESKYRYRKADRKCPDCAAAALVFTKRKTFWCVPDKGGCGKGFPEKDERITRQETGRKPNPEIFDQINTLLKMAQKRAHVGATINATSASEFFTQDVEDQAGEMESTQVDRGNGSSGSSATGVGPGAPSRTVPAELAKEQPKASGAHDPACNCGLCGGPREVPEELRLVFDGIDKDSRRIAGAFQSMETMLQESGGANGVTAYNRVVAAFRDRFPNGSETKADLKHCLLDLWAELQKVQKPEPVRTQPEPPAQDLRDRIATPKEVEALWARMGSKRELITGVLAELHSDLADVAGQKKADEEYERIETQFAGGKGKATERVSFSRRVVLELWKRIQAHKTQVNPDVDDSDIPSNIGQQGQLIDMKPEPQYAD